MNPDRWPAPVLQAPGSDDCAYATAAYIARVFGHGVTLADVRSWSRLASRIPECYPADVAGVASALLHSDGSRSWWLGPGSEAWLRDRLTRGHVGFAVVHSGGVDMHAVTLLDADDDGVLVADPLVGFARWSWARFLGAGPGATKNPLDVHYIGAWYGPLPDREAA